MEELEQFTARWLRWGEYADIEFDTEAGTATVLPNNEVYTGSNNYLRKHE